MSTSDPSGRSPTSTNPGPHADPLQTRTLGPPASVGPASPPAARFAHYTVLGLIGRGGMGEVYAAYDLELDRKVAIKLVRDPRPHADEHLLHEAKTLALLSHPNVVTVHDVGRVDGQLFVAMEFVEGQTLKQWFSEPRRGWREIVRILLDAGRGLEAAHDQGIVHRDFKPANVMLSDDGRVKVLDFGLAQTEWLPRPRTSVNSSRASHDGDSSPHSSGQVIGTPPYMAPERFLQQPADDRSDQFSFCVVLYEGLYGQRPFDESMLNRAAAGDPLPLPSAPSNIDVPVWLRRILARGLDPEPSRRWPGMAQLLQRIEHGIARGRRQRRAALGLTLLLGGLGGGIALASVGTPRPCAFDDDPLAEEWNEARQETIAARFEATGLPYAAHTFDLVRSRVDEHVARWHAVRDDACHATNVHHEQSPRLMDLRMACLQHDRLRLAAFLQVLERADTAVVERAVDAVYALGDIERCSDGDALLTDAPLAEDPDQARAIEHARGVLATVTALHNAGKYDESEAAARDALTLPEVQSFPSLRAEALLALGVAQLNVSRLEDAYETLRQACFLAQAEGLDELAAEAALELVYLVGYRLDRTDDARHWVDYAVAQVDRIDSRSMEAQLLNHRGTIARAHGDTAEAIEHHRRSLALREPMLGPNHLLIASSLNNLANALAERREWDEVLRLHRRALQIRLDALGPAHPKVGQSHHNIGYALYHDGDIERAAQEHRLALQIREAALGPDHIDVASSLSALGAVLADLGRYEESITMHRRALELRERRFGREHIVYARSLLALGITMGMQGDEASALEYLGRALATLEKVRGPDDVALVPVLVNLGAAAREGGDHRAAIGHLRRARALIDASGNSHLREGLIVLELGRGLLEVGEPEAAIEPLERAEQLNAPPHVTELLAAQTQLALARALRHTGGDTARIRALVQAAQPVLEGSSDRAGQAACEHLMEWLADNAGI